MAKRSKASGGERAAKHVSAYRAAGLEQVGGKARRWRVVRTGEVISYNAGRKRIQAFSSGHSSAIAKFERALARSGDPESARREAGMSKRSFNSYRAEFAKGDRANLSPFEKHGRKWVFRGVQGYKHTFIAMGGGQERATFSGQNLFAMQEYRNAVDMKRQIVLDGWLKRHPRGVQDDDGNWHFPETELSRIKAKTDRMTPRARARFERDVHYAAAEEKEAA